MSTVALSFSGLMARLQKARLACDNAGQFVYAPDGRHSAESRLSTNGKYAFVGDFPAMVREVRFIDRVPSCPLPGQKLLGYCAPFTGRVDEVVSLIRAYANAIAVATAAVGLFYPDTAAFWQRDPEIPLMLAGTNVVCRGRYYVLCMRPQVRRVESGEVREVVLSLYPYERAAYEWSGELLFFEPLD